MGFKESEFGGWEKTDISPSKLKTWMTCPKQFDYKYVTKAPSHSGLAMLQGSSMHDVFLEEFLQGGERECGGSSRGNGVRFARANSQ